MMQPKLQALQELKILDAREARKYVGAAGSVERDASHHRDRSRNDDSSVYADTSTFDDSSDRRDRQE